MPGWPTSTPRKEEKTSEKNEEKERDWGTEGETLYPIPDNWCAYRGWRIERKTEERKKETGSGSPTQPLQTIWFPLMICMDHMVGLFW